MKVGGHVEDDMNEELLSVIEDLYNYCNPSHTAARDNLLSFLSKIKEDEAQTIKTTMFKMIAFLKTYTVDLRVSETSYVFDDYERILSEVLIKNHVWLWDRVTTTTYEEATQTVKMLGFHSYLEVTDFIHRKGVRDRSKVMYPPWITVPNTVEYLRPDMNEITYDDGFQRWFKEYDNDYIDVFETVPHVLYKVHERDRDIEIHDYAFQKKEAFSACELVPDTHRLGIMNALLHGVEGNFLQGDTLSATGTQLKNFDLILSNPPFGTKKGGERATRDDLVFSSSNKQLNFLEIIYRSLNLTGKARAGVVLPDNVLFEGGIGKDIRQDLLNKCNVHTILRLPTGIFYAQGVKTNVLFFDRAKTDIGNTKDIWFYDLRTNMPNFGKTTPLTEKYFEEFISTYDNDEEKEKLERWTKISLDEVIKKDYSLDLGLIKDESLLDIETLPNPILNTNETIEKLEEAIDLLKSVVNELKNCGLSEED